MRGEIGVRCTHSHMPSSCPRAVRGPRQSFRRSSRVCCQQRPQESLDVGNDLPQRNRSDIESVFGYEGIPLAFLRFVRKECGRKYKGWLFRCGKRRFSPLECPLDRFQKDTAVKGEEFSEGTEVVKVLHPAIGDAQFHHRLELLGNDGLSWIGEENWLR